MALDSNPLYSRLEIVIERNRHVKNSIANVELFYILQENNMVVNLYVIQATLKKMGTIVINGKEYHRPIP
jgi:hypothetical protein